MSTKSESPLCLTEEISAYLTAEDLSACSQVNHEWSDKAMANLWRRPQFGGAETTPFQCFKRFLSSLPHVSKKSLAYIQILDVRHVEESLYDAIDDDWLTLVVTHCPKLKELLLGSVTFLTTTAIRKLERSSVSHNSVDHLDITRATNLTEITLKSLVAAFPGLKRINLDECSGITDNTLSHISYNCHELESISIAHPRSVTDVGVYALAKFCGRKIQHIRLSSALRVTDDAILALAKHCRSLETLDISFCRHVTLNSVQELVRSAHLTLHTLIINGVSVNGELPILPFLENLVAQCSELSNLSVTFPKSTAPSSFLDVLKRFQFLQSLELHDMPEHVAVDFLWDLVKECPFLRTVTVRRDRCEGDFLLGGYAKVKPTGITQRDIDALNSGNGPFVKLDVSE